MSDRTESRAKSPGVALIAAVLVVVFLVLPVLYVFSTGPVVWLIDHQYVSENVEYIYLPLSALAECCQPIKAALLWYIRLWVGLE